ncbi:hypothetical protein [Pasteurella sp. PK-2025]|uniref:hypothetical protein n=1 Tax=Pasteurella sp. PK-2025 TaxID=3413133 RepID=UPI003C736036
MSALFNLFYLYDPWLMHFFRMAFFVGVLAMLALAYRTYRIRQSYVLKGESAQPLPHAWQGIMVPVDSLVVLVMLIGISAIPMLFHGTGEWGVIKMYVKSLILFVFGIGLYNLFYHHSAGKYQCVRDLNIGIVVQAVIGLFALAGVSYFIELGLLSHIELPRFYGSEQEYRLYNLTSSAFFQLSIFYLFLLHFLLAYHKQGKGMSPIILFFLLCIGVISGRTFFMLSLFSLVLYFKWRYLPALLLFAAIVLFLALQFADHKYVAHAFEPVINLLSHHDVTRLSSSSDNLVRNHLFLPTIQQMIFGEGDYFTPDGKYYGATDSGFLRQILYGGVGYLLVCFAFTAYFVKRVADNWFGGSWVFILSTLFIFSVLNIKADTYAFPGIMFVMIMFLSLFGEKGKQRNLLMMKETQHV